uniref:Venom redulysin 9 n=1 Tax=Platymeris rhadamanthus TaxID=1134088 RepID=A0A6B9L504_PLARH|nr:venom redulysin 9 [Platymeris rhadamanthus]
MSKIWLLLLLVAVFQFVHSYPAEYDDVDEYMSDEYLSDAKNNEELGRKNDKYIGDVLKEKLRKLKKSMLEGLRRLKNKVIIAIPSKCGGGRCNNCVILKNPTKQTWCLNVDTTKIKENTLILRINKGKAFEIKLDDAPKSVDGGNFGKVYIKSTTESGKGQAKTNFCLAILGEKLKIGCIFCATYENNKLKEKSKPETFAGTLDDRGDMVKLIDGNIVYI